MNGYPNSTQWTQHIIYIFQENGSDKVCLLSLEGLSRSSSRGFYFFMSITAEWSLRVIMTFSFYMPATISKIEF